MCRLGDELCFNTDFVNSEPFQKLPDDMMVSAHKSINNRKSKVDLMSDKGKKHWNFWNQRKVQVKEGCVECLKELYRPNQVPKAGDEILSVNGMKNHSDMVRAIMQNVNGDSEYSADSIPNICLPCPDTITIEVRRKAALLSAVPPVRRSKKGETMKELEASERKLADLNFPSRPKESNVRVKPARRWSVRKIEGEIDKNRFPKACPHGVWHVLDCPMSTCGGCPHNEFKRNCMHIDCSGCIHGKLKRYCLDKQCGGCPHGKLFISCRMRECNGCSCPSNEQIPDADKKTPEEIAAIQKTLEAPHVRKHCKVDNPCVCPAVTLYNLAPGQNKEKIKELMESKFGPVKNIRTYENNNRAYVMFENEADKEKALACKDLIQANGEAIEVRKRDVNRAKCQNCGACHHKDRSNHPQCKESCKKPSCNGCPHGNLIKWCLDIGCGGCKHGRLKKDCTDIECNACPHGKARLLCPEPGCGGCRKHPGVAEIKCMECKPENTFVDTSLFSQPLAKLARERIAKNEPPLTQKEEISAMGDNDFTVDERLWWARDTSKTKELCNMFSAGDFGLRLDEGTKEATLTFFRQPFRNGSDYQERIKKGEDVKPKDKLPEVVNDKASNFLRDIRNCRTICPLAKQQTFKLMRQRLKEWKMFTNRQNNLFRKIEREYNMEVPTAQQYHEMFQLYCNTEPQTIKKWRDDIVKAIEKKNSRQQVKAAGIVYD